MKKHLCWSCKNCTSIYKCEFVKRLNDYYDEQRKKYELTHKVNKKGYFDYKPIEDINKFYIPGTEVDKKGNIIKCECYKKEENLKPENKTEYVEQISNKMRACKKTIRDKINILETHIKKVQQQKQALEQSKQQNSNEL